MAERSNKKWTCCLFGCLGTFGFTIVFLAGFFWWLTKTGEVPVEKTIFLPDAEMYVRGVVRKEDEKFHRLIADIIDANNQRNQADLPPNMQWLQSLQRESPEEIQRELAKYAPIEIELLMRGQSAEMENDFIATLGFGGSKNMIGIFYNIAKWGLRKEGNVVDIEGKEVLRIANEHDDEDFFVLLNDAIFYLTPTQETMAAAISNQKTQAEIDGSLNPLYGLDTSATVYGFLSKHSLAIFPVFLGDEFKAPNWVFDPETETLTGYEASITQIGFDIAASPSGELVINSNIFTEGSDSLQAFLEQTGERLQKDSQAKFTSQVLPEEFGYRLTVNIANIEGLQLNFDEEASYDAPPIEIEGPESTEPPTEPEQ